MNINEIPITMKAKFITSILGAIFMVIPSLAQDKTTVRANSSDISDNLDLRAVATIFGDSKDLEDFERRLNDPKSQISNLDLNNDNYVDYLRVIETIEGNAHIIVIQAVLDKDLYQDIASVEVEKDGDNVAVQVVGDVYMYGNNYIYEPVYVHRPIIYTTFWAPYYRPYYSVWYWNYYPSYYSCWRPFPIFRYRNHIAVHINFGISFNYVSYRRCGVAYNAYYGRRANGYERRYPNRSFTHRNSGYANRHELDRNRTIRTRVPGSRELAYNSPRSSSVTPRSNNSSVNPRTSTPRSYSNSNPRNYNEPRTSGNSGVKPRTYSNNNPRSNSEVKPRTYSNNTPRGNSDVKPRTQSNNTPRNTPRTYEPRNNTPRSTPNRNYSEPRRGNNGSYNSGGNRGGNSTSRSNSSGSRSSNRGGNSGRSGRV